MTSLARAAFPALASVMVACCSTVAPPADGPGPGTASAVAPSVTGHWSSPSCGERAYERRLTLEPNGSFTAEDRISPCPPGTRCIWSGIVFTRGTYTISGGELQLAFDPIRGKGQPLPTSLAIDAATGAPIEVLPEGPRCVYARTSP